MRMLALILPEYLSLLIDDADAEKLGERAILKEIKLLKKILGTNTSRRALGQLAIDPDDLIPWSKLKSCGMETLAAFAHTQSSPRHPKLD